MLLARDNNTKMSICNKKKYAYKIIRNQKYHSYFGGG